MDLIKLPINDLLPFIIFLSFRLAKRTLGNNATFSCLGHCRG